MKPLIVDVRHLYPPSCTFEASVRTHALFFKLTLCPLSTTTRYSSHAHCTLLHKFIYFSLRKDLPPILTLHAVCVPCPQPSPTRASTGTTPHLRRLRMCSQHPSTVPASSEARQTSLGLAHAREASSSEPPSTERCARCRHGATYRRAGPPDGRIRPARALSWTPLSLRVSAQKLVMSWHR